jgi:hypothetical protein
MTRLSAALLLLTGTLFAQTPQVVHADPSANSVILRSIPTGTDCPIGFRADRQSTSQILSASDARKNGSALGLHLTLDHRTAPAIESIEVTVYGVSPQVRALPANLLTPKSSDDNIVSKTFELKRSASSDTLTDADVWMHQVGALRWADLIAVHYTNGTSWHTADHESCRAVPSNVILVGQR